MPSSHAFILCLVCADSLDLSIGALINQSSKRVSSKWGATIPMNPEVAQAPGDDCTQMPCGISQAAPQTGPDEYPPATFLPLSLTAAHGDFLQHVRQRLPV